ncbi:hypothetical protein [Demequina sediminicola]|uniref:hypothetical protein n=1 Tax=Demequina sediminicola TaxID=1095026 RepID=UPI0007816CC4|nr:hypothetical protein [Demequina sediminicola]
MDDKEPTRPAVPDNARKYLNGFMLALALTVVLYLFSVPLAYGMFLTAPIAIVLGIIVLIRTNGIKELSAMRLAVVFGLAMSGFAMFVGAGLALFHDTIDELSTCMARAVTNSAVQTCESNYEEGLNDTIDGLYDRFGIPNPNDSSSPSATPSPSASATASASN